MQKKGDGIWESFAGGRIVLAGIHGPEYQAFFQSLVSISRTSSAGFRVLDGVENIQEGDYVLLFARPTAPEAVPPAPRERRRTPARENKDWSAPFEETARHMKWEKSSGLWKQAGEEWNETLQLLGQMQQLIGTKPAAVLLLSGNEVYGACFGTAHARPEEEIGYVCHTAGSDIAAQCMRTAEHFACALEQVPIRVGRMGTLPEGEALSGLLEACARVLLYGADSEIYNLPCEAEEAQPQETELEEVQRTSVKEPDFDESESAREKKLQPEKREMPTAGTEAGPAAGRKIISFRKKAESLQRKGPYPAAKEPAHVQVKTYAEQGEAPFGTRRVLEKAQIVTDTEKVDKLGK